MSNDVVPWEVNSLVRVLCQVGNQTPKRSMDQPEQRLQKRFISLLPFSSSLGVAVL
jgi:hypothetical protein